MFEKLINLFRAKPFPVSTRYSNGVEYTALNMPTRNIAHHHPRYGLDGFRAFKGHYNSLYQVSPMLVERLFRRFEETFCVGENNYEIVRNFIIGYQILHGIHMVREFFLDEKIWLTEPMIAQLNIDFPDYLFTRCPGYDGDPYFIIRNEGFQRPSREILEIHYKLRSR